MSITTLSKTMARISKATESSKIAVFLLDDGYLETFFADTCHFTSRDKLRLIGVYDNTMDPKMVRREIVEQST